MEELGEYTTIKVPRAMAERIDRMVAAKEDGHASRNSYALSKIREGLEADEERHMRLAGYQAWLEEYNKGTPMNTKRER